MRVHLPHQIFVDAGQRIGGLLAAAILGLAATASQAETDVPFRSWTNQRLGLFASGNSYSQEGNRLTVRSEDAVSLLWKELPKPAWTARNARWSWEVLESVPPTALDRKGGDDRNLSLYFVFLPEAVAEQMQGRTITKLLNEESVRVLMYVWGGNHRSGEILSSPYLGARGKTIAMRPAGTGEARVAVDLASDFSTAFGAAPGALVGLAISSDTDDTDSQVNAVISDLVLD